MCSNRLFVGQDRVIKIIEIIDDSYYTPGNLEISKSIK